MTWQNKLVGDEDERAVSPVIGVILMVAITVILAAVIAAFVLDLGQSQSANANAGVSFEGNSTYVEVQVTDMGNADEVEVRNGSTTVNTMSGVGETTEVGAANPGSNQVDVTVVAISGDDENVINNYPSE